MLHVYHLIYPYIHLSKDIELGLPSIYESAGKGHYFSRISYSFLIYVKYYQKLDLVYLPLLTIQISLGFFFFRDA